MSCRRDHCADCGEPLVHLYNRKMGESSSGLGHVIHHQGPTQITLGDIDLYACRFYNGGEMLRLLEHKQLHQKMGLMQGRVLRLLDTTIRYAAEHNLFGLQLGSGVYEMRGSIGQRSDNGAVDFLSVQTVTTLDGQVVLTMLPESQAERDRLWDWLCAGQPWTPHQRARENR